MNKCVPTIVALGVSITGCSKLEAWQNPEVVACEDFTKAKLKAPATYKRVKTSTIDEQIPLSAWDSMDAELMGKLADDSPFRELNKKNHLDGGVRSVLLEYDAANSFGTPLRGVEVCKFLMTSFADDKSQSKPSADRAKLSRMMWQLEKNDTTEPTCCLADREIRAIEGAKSKKATL